MIPADERKSLIRGIGYVHGSIRSRRRGPGQTGGRARAVMAENKEVCSHPGRHGDLQERTRSSRDDLRWSQYVTDEMAELMEPEIDVSKEWYAPAPHQPDPPERETPGEGQQVTPPRLPLSGHTVNIGIGVAHHKPGTHSETSSWAPKARSLDPLSLSGCSDVLDAQPDPGRVGKSLRKGRSALHGKVARTP